jgi:pentatricopeptide repeat protein
MGSHASESAYMALIRCYSDNGEIHRALSLIDEMKELNLELKLRSYHPILEAAWRANNFDIALSVINKIAADGVIPRSEQLTLLLEVGASSGALKDTRNIGHLHQLLQSDKLDLLDMETSMLQRVAAAFRGVSVDRVVGEVVMQGSDFTQITPSNTASDPTTSEEKVVGTLQDVVFATPAVHPTPLSTPVSSSISILSPNTHSSMSASTPVSFPGSTTDEWNIDSSAAAEYSKHPDDITDRTGQFHTRIDPKLSEIVGVTRNESEYSSPVLPSLTPPQH